MITYILDSSSAFSLVYFIYGYIYVYELIINGKRKEPRGLKMYRSVEKEKHLKENLFFPFPTDKV